MEILLRIEVPDSVLTALRNMECALADIARAFAVRLRDEEFLKDAPNHPVDESDWAKNSPAFESALVDGAGDADASPIASVPCVPSEPSLEVSRPAAACSERVRTDDRQARLLAMKAEGISNKQILLALNSMPGKLVKAQALEDWIYRLRKDGKLPCKDMVAPPAEKVSAAPEDSCSRGNDGVGSGNEGPARPVMTAADVIARRQSLAPDKTPVAAALNGRISEVRKPPEPMFVDYDQARTWAADRGLVSGHEALDMNKVNAKRRALGLSVFVIRNKGARKAA